MAWDFRYPIHFYDDRMVYQKLSTLYLSAKGISESTAGTNEVTAFGTVPFPYGQRMDFRRTHGGLGKSVPGLSQSWRERNSRQQTRGTAKTTKQKTGGIVMSNYWKNWLKAAGIRAVKTVAQTAIATIGTSAVLGDVNWVMVASASALSGLLSLLTSISGIPEVAKGDEE